MHIKTAWNDHFTVTSPTNPYISQTYTQRQTPSDTSLYIFNCLFKSITSSSAGGALYCTSATYFLVESTSFFSCKTSNSGGSIYFSNTNGGQSVLYGVCGYDCYSTGSVNYPFAYIQVNSAASSKNYVNYSSIVRCVNEISSTCNMFGLINGKNFCPSVNSSLNKCGYYSVISCWPTSNSNSAACSLTHSSFTNNTATYYNCFWLSSSGSIFEIKSCNILRNTQGSFNTEGIIWTSGNLNIEDSCVLENNAANIFYQSSSSYTITLSNCTVDKTTYNQNLMTQNTVAKSFILALNHMSTENCHSEYDSAGTLTPIIQTPSSSKKQRLCYSYVKLFYQPRLCLESTFIFIFHFIHPQASN
jgi:hypothetical protein